MPEHIWSFSVVPILTVRLRQQECKKELTLILKWYFWVSALCFICSVGWYYMYVTGLQIIVLPWKGICPTRAPFWSDKRKIWSDINTKVHLKEKHIRKSNFICKWYSQMLQHKIGRTECPTKVAILSDIGKFWSAIVRWPTVTCSIVLVKLGSIPICYTSVTTKWSCETTHSYIHLMLYSHVLVSLSPPF